MIAQYTATRKIKTLSFFKSPQERNQPLKVIEVSGKVEAKKVAKENNATPWNF